MVHQTDLQDAGKFLQQGNYKRALKAAQLAAKKSPKSAVAPNIIGIATSAIGRPNEAIAHFQKALKLQPDFPEAQKNLAQTLILIGRADTAVALLAKLAATAPNDWQAWFLKAQGELALRRENDALHSTEKAQTAAPRNPAIYHLRSKILLSLGKIKDAIDALETVLQINPDDVQALTQLSLPLARQNRTQEALDVVQKAVALAPNDIPARYRLATQYVEMGDTAEAIKHYTAILAIQPDNPDALEQLTLLRPAAEIVDMEPQIRSALNKAAKNTEERASLFFALAKVLTAKDDTAQARKMLGLANKEMAKLRPYDPVADAAVTRATLDRFAQPEAHFDDAPQGPKPIFVLGLPRSGTTLVETVLGLHPNVAPLGERGTAGFLLRDIIEHNLPFTAKDAAALVREDQRLLPDLPEDTVAYIDKMPENYRLVGFLKMAYPNARIAHVRRDPRDIALSMWKSHFSGAVLSYSYDLDWMAEKFNLYAQSMAHWRAVLPGQILDVRYEDLVQDIATTGARMAAFCDLTWHDAMAHPERSTTAVLTLSATQVRRPVHTGSIGKWRKDPGILDDFVTRLDPALWGDYLN